MADVGFTADFTFEMDDLGVGGERVDHFFEIPCLEQPVHSIDEVDGTTSVQYRAAPAFVRRLFVVIIHFEA
jgi:hypothetical protein